MYSSDNLENSKYFACFPFCSEDLRLCAYVEEISGRQRLIMKRIDLNSRNILYQESIDCIHTAICDIRASDFDETINDENFENQILKIRSSETLHEIILEPEEKFKAFKSWVAGIAEAGIHSFKIQGDIERIGKLMTPISSRLLKFVARSNIEVLYELIDYIERECIYEGLHHEASMIANLDPIIASLPFEMNKKKDIIRAIISINPPLNLFTKNPSNIKYLSYPELADWKYFDKLFDENKDIRHWIAKNPRINEFERFYELFTDNEMIVRRSVAENNVATELNEFSRFLSIKTEPNWIVRLAAVNNPGAKRFKEYKLFKRETISFIDEIIDQYNKITEDYIKEDYSFNNFEPLLKFIAENYKNTELVSNIMIEKLILIPKIQHLIRTNSKHSILLRIPFVLKYFNISLLVNSYLTKVKQNIAINPNGPDYSEYSKFLSESTEPSNKIRISAATNLNAPNFEEYRNFLSYITEKNVNVRKRAAKNINAMKFKEYSNFLSIKTEPNPIIRINAAKNMESTKFKAYSNFLSYKTEPDDKVRLAAASNKKAIILQGFHNLMNKNTEPNIEIRKRAKKTYNIYRKKMTRTPRNITIATKISDYF